MMLCRSVDCFIIFIRIFQLFASAVVCREFSMHVPLQSHTPRSSYHISVVRGVACMPSGHRLFLRRRRLSSAFVAYFLVFCVYLDTHSQREQHRCHQQFLFSLAQLFLLHSVICPICLFVFCVVWLLCGLAPTV